MRVFPLELVDLRLADSCYIGNTWSHAVGRLLLPVLGSTVVGNTCK